MTVFSEIAKNRQDHARKSMTNAHRIIVTLVLAFGICLYVLLRAHWLGGRIPPTADMLIAVVVFLTLISALWIKRTIESVQCICYSAVALLALIDGNRATFLIFFALAIWAAYDWIAKAKKRAPDAHI